MFADGVALEVDVDEERVEMVERDGSVVRSGSSFLSVLLRRRRAFGQGQLTRGRGGVYSQMYRARMQCQSEGRRSHEGISRVSPSV
jgi:hypothetical protein